MKIDKMLPFYICVSCHKQDFEKKLLKVNSTKVQGVKLKHSNVFNEAVTNFLIEKYESPKNINMNRSWYEAGCEIIENVPYIM